MGGNNSGFPFGEGAGALRMEGDDRDPLERLGSLSFSHLVFLSTKARDDNAEPTLG